MSAMARVVLIALLLVVASDVAKARKVSTKTTKLDAARFEVDDVFSPLQAELLKLAGLREVEYEFPNDAKMRSLARNASPKIAKVAGSASSENDRVGADNLDSEDPAFQGKYPVIFIPGLMGSQLQVKLSDRKDPPNWLCRRTNEEWSRVWMIDRLHMVGERPSYLPPPPRHNTLSLEEHKLTSALARLEKVARARELLGAGRHGSVERDLEDTRPSVGGDREPRSSRLGRCHEPGP